MRSMEDVVTTVRERLPGVEMPPEVRLDLSNVEEWTEFYSTHGPGERMLRATHALLDLATDPYTGAPEGFREEVAEHVASGNPTLVLMDHDSIVDPFNVGAVAHKYDFMRWIIANYVIPARPKDFNNPAAALFLTYANAKPVVREKDLVSYQMSLGLSKEEAEAVVAAEVGSRVTSNSPLQQVMVGAVNDGLIYGSFPGGERKEGDPALIQKPVKSGPKRLLEGIDNADRAKIVYIAFNYQGARMLPKRYLTPTIHMDIRDAPPLDDNFNAEVERALQENLDAAMAHQRPGVPLSPVAKFAALTAVAGGALLADKLMRRDR